MVEVAAHLTDHVLPPLPLRQWVLSLPKRIRPFLPHDPRLAGDVLRVLLRGIRTTLHRASPSAPGDAPLGAISFLHRFGSAHNPHFHFHVVVLNGVFSEGDDGSLTFHEATHLSADDVLRLERTLQRRILRLFQRRGILAEDTVEVMLTWQASGGFSLDASVRIRHRYHGVLAPNARMREQVIHSAATTSKRPAPRPSRAGHHLPSRTGTATAGADATDLPDSPQSAVARSRWARLLARIYEVFPLTCPDCGASPPTGGTVIM
jgi:hypothetical protein